MAELDDPRLEGAVGKCVAALASLPDADRQKVLDRVNETLKPPPAPPTEETQPQP
jgi:hypothetical protein